MRISINLAVVAMVKLPNHTNKFLNTTNECNFQADDVVRDYVSIFMVVHFLFLNRNSE